MNQMQALVDRLAEQLGQPVGVDDRRYRAIAYSSHTDEIDEVRRTSILGRQAPHRVMAWLDALGIARAEGVVRVPANPELHMVPRVCFPLRFHGRLLGFLWLTEEQAPLTPWALARIDLSTEVLAQELLRLDQDESDQRHREAETVRRLTGLGDTYEPNGTVPAVASATYVVAVVDASSRGVPAPQVSVRLTAATDRVRRTLAPGDLLALVDDRRAVVLVTGAATAAVESIFASLLAAAHEELADVDSAWVTVGVAGPRSRRDELPAARHEAELTSRVARSASELGPLAFWSELGAYRLVAELVGDRDPSTLLPASLRMLLADADAASLTQTVEAYLERGGDAATAAADLFIHRSSLYNRLRRVEQVANVDMQSGSDRLELQLGLRLWRLAGPHDG
jgi:DNA-binding PucR family transcriptional regulator